MNAYYFRRGKNCRFGCEKKPSYHFRKANISCKIRGIQFCSLQFSIIWIVSYRIWTDQIMLAHTNVPFKGHSEIRESGKLHSKPLFYYFSLGAPVPWETVPVNITQTRQVRVTFAVPWEPDISFGFNVSINIWLFSENSRVDYRHCRAFSYKLEGLKQSPLLTCKISYCRRSVSRRCGNMPT